MHVWCCASTLRMAMRAGCPSAFAHAASRTSASVKDWVFAVAISFIVYLRCTMITYEYIRQGCKTGKVFLPGVRYPCGSQALYWSIRPQVSLIPSRKNPTGYSPYPIPGTITPIPTMPRHLLLISTSTTHGTGYLDHAADAIEALL